MKDTISKLIMTEISANYYISKYPNGKYNHYIERIRKGLPILGMGGYFLVDAIKQAVEDVAEGYGKKERYKFMLDNFEAFGKATFDAIQHCLEIESYTNAIDIRIRRFAIPNKDYYYEKDPKILRDQIIAGKIQDAINDCYTNLKHKPILVPAKRPIPSAPPLVDHKEERKELPVPNAPILDRKEAVIVSVPAQIEGIPSHPVAEISKEGAPSSIVKAPHLEGAPMVIGGVALASTPPVPRYEEKKEEKNVAPCEEIGVVKVSLFKPKNVTPPMEDPNQPGLRSHLENKPAVSSPVKPSISENEDEPGAPVVEPKTVTPRKIRQIVLA